MKNPLDTSHTFYFVVVVLFFFFNLHLDAQLLTATFCYFEATAPGISFETVAGRRNTATEQVTAESTVGGFYERI